MSKLIHMVPMADISASPWEAEPEFVKPIWDWQPEPEVSKPNYDASQKRKEFCFRVEVDDGRGLYSHSAGAHEFIDLYQMNSRHPAPTDDEKLRQFYKDHISWTTGDSTEQYYFGFANMEQLRRWVYTSLQELKDIGFAISIYQTDDYCVGDTQMVFRKSTATLIGRADLI